MSVQAAAHHLQGTSGGAGLLLGVPGTPAAKVTIIGGGVAGTEAAKMALGLRAIVRVLDTNAARLSYLSDVFGGRLGSSEPGADCGVRGRIRCGDRRRSGRRRERRRNWLPAT